MKTVWILTLLALAAISLSGCSSCGGGLFGNWFNRNDCCPPQCATNPVNGGQRYATRPLVADGTHLEAAAAPAR